MNNKIAAILCIILLIGSLTQAQGIFENRLYSGAYAPQGNQIAFVGFNTIEIYSNMLAPIVTLSIPPETINGITAEPRPYQIAWSPDGTKLAASVALLAGDGGSDRLMIWDTTTWNRVHNFENAGSPIVWSGDSQMIAANSNRNVAIFNITNGQRSHEFSPGPGSNINEIAWNPMNLSQLLVLSNTALEIWDFDTQIGTVPTIAHRVDRLIAYSPDGTQFAVSDWRDIQIWDSQDLTLVRTLQNHTQGVEMLTWLDVGLVSTSSGTDQITYLWDVSNNTFVELTSQGTATSIVSPTASTYVIGSVDGKFVINTNDRVVIASLIYGNQPPTANAGPNQTLTDTDNSGSESVTLDGSASSDTDGTIVSYSWSEGGTEIATGVDPTVDLAVGMHTIMLTVTDDKGAEASATLMVVVTDLASLIIDFDPNFFAQRSLEECTTDFPDPTDCWIHVSVLNLQSHIQLQGESLTHENLIVALIQGEYGAYILNQNIKNWGDESIARQFYFDCGDNGCQDQELYPMLDYFQSPLNDTLVRDYVQFLRNKEDTRPYFNTLAEAVLFSSNNGLNPNDPSWRNGVQSGLPYGYGTRGIGILVNVSDQEVDRFAQMCGFAAKTSSNGENPRMGQMS